MRIRWAMVAGLGAIVIALIVFVVGAGSSRAATTATPCTPTPTPSGTGYWTPFGDATWTGTGLQTSSQSAPNQPYGVTCGGAAVYGTSLPTTNPSQITALSFDFNASQTGPSGTSPRMVVCFSDGSNCSSNASLAPSAWVANAWTHVDGFNPPTGLNASWSNSGGTCGTKYGTTWSAIVACHPGSSIELVAVTNDSGAIYPSGEQVLLNNLTVNNVVAHASPPVFGQTATVAPTLGQVFVKRPGARRFRQVKTITSLPYGSVVNATGGTIQVIGAKSGGGTQSGDFYAGKFRLTQGHDGFVTAALLSHPAVCPGKESAHVSSTFSLWGHVKGHYRTKGHNGSASVYGTIWFTQEQCDGTFFHVVKGFLLIRDFTRHKTLILTAGHSYLAPASLPKKGPKPDSDGDHDGD